MSQTLFKRVEEDVRMSYGSGKFAVNVDVFSAFTKMLLPVRKQQGHW